MTIFPIILDSQPAYLGRTSNSTSLLQLPVGRGTLLDHVCQRLPDRMRRNIIVAPTFAYDEAYDRSMREHPSVEEVVASAELDTWCVQAEPSDWLLFVDARLSCEADNFGWIASKLTEDPRKVWHRVVLDRRPGGVHDRIEFDPKGLIRSIRRYYDAVTWSKTVAVACSLLPSSYLNFVQDADPKTLSTLRELLFAQGLPCDDLPLPKATRDLNRETDMLQLAQAVVLNETNQTSLTGGATAIRQGERCLIHPTARLIGPVVLQDDVVVADGAMVVGPATIGCRARIDPGATVVHSVVAADTTVSDGMTVQNRVWDGTGGTADREEAAAVPRGIEYADLASTGSGSLYEPIKSVTEFVLATIALVVLSPLFALIAILIKLDSRGPVFFSDLRESTHGRTFRCLKFRTMVAGADAAQHLLRKYSHVDGPQFKMNGDPRVTRVGRWLRACSLDELPQLVNVALGHMSFVGPRPSPFSENQTCIAWREGRLSVRPGITGLWQVCRHDRSDGDFHQWIYFDLAYVRHASPIVDLKILLATVLTLGGRGHVPVSWIIPRRRLESA